ncbi:hypothetical protein M3Y98_00715700 [Aphelenchoides besseyi]|nr:hypothetical protein M3Y98_00715700 [Aphelenchoides besseyi]
MKTLALFFLLSISFVCGQQEDSNCIGVLAESYTPFRKDEHNRTGYVINEIRRVRVDHNDDDIIVTKKKHEKEFLATGLTHDNSITLPRKLAEQLFGSAVKKNIITVGCKQQFNLEFRIGNHWFKVPSSTLIEKRNGKNCELKVKAYDDTFILFGAPFLDRHCFFNDKDGILIIILIISLIILITCYRNLKRIYASTLQELSVRLAALEGGVVKSSN